MEDSKLLKHSRLWDRAGLWTSAACLIHCIAIPIVAIGFPLLSETVMHSMIHWFLLPIVASVAIFSFCFSFKKHRNKGPVLIGSTALLLLVLAPVAEDWGEGTYLEIGLMIAGSTLLIAGHLWNIHACHCFCEASCSHEEHSNEDHTVSAETLNSSPLERIPE